MIQHIVLFKIKPDTSLELLNTFTSKIKSLKTITGVSKVSVGPTFTLDRNRGYTHALVVELINRDALSSYAKNDYHIKVIQENILPIVEKDGILAMDIED